LTIRCADGHEWRASVDNLVYARSCSLECMSCSNTRRRFARLR
jgi:hypothetical protein